MAQKLLHRSTDDRMISGVLGGLSEYFDIPSQWLRLGATAIGGYMLGSTGLLLTTIVMIGGYVSAVFIIPEAKTSSVKSKPKKRSTKKSAK